MRGEITAKLKEIENSNKIKIFYAAESGSRGWGFASKDSDYDVRFLYVQHPKKYLSIEEIKDVIEYHKFHSLDINGWDIKKALQLFRKSNPPLYEWFSSPIVYVEKGSAAQKMKGLMPNYYSPQACLHHYLSMAKRTYKAYLTSEKVKVKKYFYALRPILACMWIEQEKSMPPMEFVKLLSAQKPDNQLVKEINSLLKRKKSGDELDLEDRIEIINAFLEEKLNYFENNTKPSKKHQMPDIATLNKLFRNIIKEYWGRFEE